MSDNHELYSSYIKSGIITGERFRFFRMITGIIFNRVNLDDESRFIINDHKEKGVVVYACMQTTYTSLYILGNALKRCSLPHPTLGLGFVPYSYQKIFILLSSLMTVFKRVIRSKGVHFVRNSEYIENTLREGNLAFSMLSRKLFLRRYVQIKTDVIDYLLEMQKKSDKPIYVFPQVIYWNMNPEKPGSIMRSDATVDRGLISGMITIWKSATPSFVRIGKPVNLKEELENSQGGDLKHLSRQIRTKLLETYNYEKRSILGPQIKSQQEMMEKVLYHRNVLDVIQQDMADKGTPEKKLRRKAFSYFREIAADFSIIYIRFFKATNDYLFKKLFDNIHYDLEDFKRLREASSKGPIILVPSHKSHMDYIIISSLFYHNKMIPPHIFAGSNLTFFPMGKIFRRSGAFFVRRTFKGLNLYAAVLKQYLKTLVNEGYTIEFFIEGTRSRTGKIIHPKMGVLKYLIEAIDEGYNRDLVFAPLTVNYDRILEENSYLKEIKGKEKTKESTSGFIKSRKLIQRKYGSVYMGFTEPFCLSDARELFKKEKNITNIDDLTVELGYFIVKKINEAVVATPFAVTTAALLNTTERGFTRGKIRERLGMLLTFLRKTDYKLSDVLKSDDNNDSVIDMVFNSFMGDGIISRVSLGQDGVKDADNEGDDLYIIDHEQRGRITLYKNSIIHMTLPLNMMALAVIITSSDNKASRENIISEYEKIRDSFKKDFVYADSMYDSNGVYELAINHFAEEKMLSSDSKGITYNDDGSEKLKFFAGMIQDYIESYLVVLTAMSDSDNSGMPRKDFVSEVRKTGTRMYHLNLIQCSESLSIINYNNAIDRFIEAGLLAGDGEGKKSHIIIKDKKRITALKNTITEYLDKVRSS
ncbi:MAG TPA: 1-acyl-sn-glycerol-3-phosphate acyltransferase [Spirochaetota bacterium]|nr:1-acyl-sn-glycerol-3-phosphate acyltransferase [Spirochaetota bacterium]